MSLLKKSALTAVAIATISMAALGAGATDASAGGWKKHKHFKHFYNHHYAYDYGYYCKPRYRKIWVWSPRHGHKIKKWVRINKYCGRGYYEGY